MSCERRMSVWWMESSDDRYFRQGRQLLLTFLTMARVGHSLRPFFMLTGHNFTGDFMWKIFAVS